MSTSVITQLAPLVQRLPSTSINVEHKAYVSIQVHRKYAQPVPTDN